MTGGNKLGNHEDDDDEDDDDEDEKLCSNLPMSSKVPSRPTPPPAPRCSQEPPQTMEIWLGLIKRK